MSAINPEVEIRHRFDDPGHRVGAFLFFARMNDWVGENNTRGKLMAVILDGDWIAWRFGFQTRDQAADFDAVFDPVEGKK